MFKLKNFIINQIMSLKVVSDLPGEIVFKNSKLLSILSDNKEYEFLILKALKVNKDIERVEFSYSDETIRIFYKKEDTNGTTMEKWANIVLTTILDNLDVVKNALENKQYVDEMIEDIECQLIDKLNEI
ncbi:MAG: hypothetical protein Q4B63_05025 [Clostridium perfringens]|nr:hypothetical protein [Clostridium perfringens]